MKSRRSLVVFGFVLMLAVIDRSAAADTTYSYFYTAGNYVYSITPGAVFSVPIYLEEINSDQSSNSLLTTEDGLSAAGVNIHYLSGDNSTVITAADANIGSVPTAFDDPSSSATVSGSRLAADIMESTDPFPFGSDETGAEVPANSQIDGISKILLGTLTIQASDAFGQSTLYSVDTENPSSPNTFTNNNSYDLDNAQDPLNPAGASSLYSSAAGVNFTVVTVPEPVTFSALIGIGLMLSSRRRRCD